MKKDGVVEIEMPEPESRLDVSENVCQNLVDYTVDDMVEFKGIGRLSRLSSEGEGVMGCIIVDELTLKDAPKKKIEDAGDVEHEGMTKDQNGIRFKKNKKGSLLDAFRSKPQEGN